MIYNYFDLLGDLGGVTEIILLVFGFFLLPISKHSFILKATKKLFLARTKRDDLFAAAHELNIDEVVEEANLDVKDGIQIAPARHCTNENKHR